MPYIDASYYNDAYKGVPVADAQLLERLIVRASDLIDHLIKYKLQGVDLNELAPFVLEQVKKATASQVEFLAINGETASTVSEGGGGFRVGNYSESGMSAGAEDGPSFYDRYAITVVEYLKPTGLLYVGIDSYG